MKHILITRVNFSDDFKFEKYFKVMKKIYIPSINSQTNKNFTLGLSVNPKHYPLIRNLIDEKIEIVKFTNVKDELKNYVIDNGFKIQTRHDCDDYMSPDYIDFLQDEVLSKSKKLNDLILTFQPIKYDYITGQEFLHERDYSKVCSMFSTLYQKDVKNGIFDVVHDHLKRLSPNIFYIKKTYVKLTIHENNMHSKFNVRIPIL
jgi:hypothetical protein